MELPELNNHQFPLPLHDQPSQHHYTKTLSDMFGYALSQSQSAMAALPSVSKMSETKPRLGKDEVDVLEREFQRNPKPTTQTKKGFADEMGVDLPRINNWFQNRRAKRKQEKKQEAYEASQKGVLAISEAATTGYFVDQPIFDDDAISSSHSSRAPSAPTSCPTPAVTSYNPRYTDPTGASMESLHRTMAMAQAGVLEPEFDAYGFPQGLNPVDIFGAPVLCDGDSHVDRARFPSAQNDSLAQIHGVSSSFGFEPTFLSEDYNTAISELRASGSPSLHIDSVQVGDGHPLSEIDSNGVHDFPSQIKSQSHDGLGTQMHGIQDENSSQPCPSAIGFNIELAEGSSSSLSPPAPTGFFKAPPPPTDLASRRKKVQNKPTALVPDAIRGRPSTGPRTVSQAEGFKRTVASPLSSPMRRIVSAGGNRSVMTGRIQKSGIDSAQRSPMPFQGFQDLGAFMEAHHQNIRHTPSLYGSLAPPTPMSPRELEGTDTSGSSASPPDMSLMYPFNANMATCYPTMENLVSPPETPQANYLKPPLNGWSGGETLDPWSFDINDEPQFTPAHESFTSDQIRMPQPTYLKSQPVTPGFAHFDMSSILGYKSPQFNEELPPYMLGIQGQAEYTILESQQYPYNLSDAMSKQKTFQFSNTTPADFIEK